MSGQAAPRRFPWAIYIVVLVLIVLVAASPLLSALGAGAIAGANGCALDEGSIHPCLIFGADWGGALYGFGVLGWLVLASVPIGVVALIVWIIVLLVHLALRRRAK